jgi:hypothetical protein
MISGKDRGVPVVWRRAVGRSVDLKPAWRASAPEVLSNAPGKQRGRAVSPSSQSPESEPDRAPNLNMVDLLNVKLSYERAV